MTAGTEPDTIVAISTPPGRGGIGMARLSGPAALAIAAAVAHTREPLQHAHARFGHIPDPADANELLDQAMVTFFRGPQSYTGDDLVEITTHGSPVVLEAVLNAALARGARLAQPGEFTKRAFLAGKIDLSAAEAVHDLIAAQTLQQARAAAQQLGGALSRRVAPIKENLLHLIALLEAGMDFASGELDDVDLVLPAQIATFLQTVTGPLVQLARSFEAGALLRSGVVLALVGRPNAGKSSLFNRLLERPRAIVTPIPGTTRDTVEETWALEGIPVRLVDTAGLRFGGEAPVDEAERQGIERTREALADADVVLLVHDATEPFSSEEQVLAGELSARPHLIVRNKADLLKPPAPQATGRPLPVPSLTVSALTGEGIGELRAALLEALHADGGLATAGALNNRRQLDAVQASLRALDRAAAANQSALPHEILLLDLHEALRALDELTGATTTEDILGRIFSTFCIGK